MTEQEEFEFRLRLERERGGGSVPAQEAPAEPSSALERFGRGFAAPFVGSVQGGANVSGMGDEWYNQVASDFARKQKQNAAGELDIAGGVGQALNPINLLASRLGPTAAGATFGATTPVETTGGADYASKVAQNTAIDAAGGKVLNVVGRRLISPLMDQGKQALVRAGVNLTPGQRGGALARGIEAVTEKVPLIGSLVKNRKADAIADYTRAQGRRILDRIGEQLPDNVRAGQDMVRHVTQAVGREYDRVLAAGRAVVDRPLMQQVQQIYQRIGQLPAAERQRAMTMVNNYLVDPLWRNGRMAGEEVQRMVGQLRARAASHARSQNPLDGDIADILNESRRALIGSFERSSSPRVAQAYAAVRGAYADLVPVQQASGAAQAVEGVFDPRQHLTAITARSTRGQRGQGAVRGQQEAQDALRVLGTMPRRADDAGMSAVGVNLPTALMPVGAATAAGYTRPGMALVNALLNRRPEGADALAALLQEQGGSGTAAIVDMLRQQGQQ